jgi:Lrp/AsnC family transcriptional regulator, leucine-responsive regulatory protein
MDKIHGRIDESLRQKKPLLDRKDKQILSYLSENSRVPLTQLQKIVQLSRDSINYRMKKLMRENVIIKFFPIIDLKRFGFFTFHTFLLIDERNKERNREFIEYLVSLPYVKNVIEYSDIWDLEIVTVAKNVWDYDRKFNEITSKYHDIILEKDKIQIIKGYNSIHLPYQFYNEAKHTFKLDNKSAKDVNLDETDMKILSLLCTDSRIPLHNISGQVGLTSEAVSYRMKKMWDANVIRKYSCVINLSALGFNWFTFMIQTKTFDIEWDKKIKRFVMGHPYIIRAVKTIGRWDFLFYIVAESPKAFHTTAKEIKHEFSDIIRTHDTLLTYKEYCYSPLPKYVVNDFIAGKAAKDVVTQHVPEEFYKDVE